MSQIMTFRRMGVVLLLQLFLVVQPVLGQEASAPELLLRLKISIFSPTR